MSDSARLREPETLRVIQISDCHVSANVNARYRSQSADQNLALTLQAARQWKPDLLLVTGDVSEDGSRASYKRTSELFHAIGVPVAALPGNHDDRVLMSEYFPEGPWEGPYVTERAGWQLTLLDSTEPGQISGSFSARELQQLQQALQGNPSSNHLLALHHQPLMVGAGWIDRYPLDSPEEFFEICDRIPGIRGVVWGHIHHEFSSDRNGVALMGAPSSVANSLAGTGTFTLDASGPACRWLELSAEGRIETGILLAGG
jgi:Icc protein